MHDDNHDHDGLDHDHHDHDHSHPHEEISITELPGYYDMLETAVRELLVERKLFGADEIRRQIEVLDSRTPALGANAQRTKGTPRTTAAHDVHPRTCETREPFHPLGRRAQNEGGHLVMRWPPR